MFQNAYSDVAPFTLRPIPCSRNPALGCEDQLPCGSLPHRVRVNYLFKSGKLGNPAVWIREWLCNPEGFSQGSYIVSQVVIFFMRARLQIMTKLLAVVRLDYLLLVWTYVGST